MSTYFISYQLNRKEGLLNGNYLIECDKFTRETIDTVREDIFNNMTNNFINTRDYKPTHIVFLSVTKLDD